MLTTILSLIGVSVACLVMTTSAVILTGIPRTEATVNHADDGLMLFAPLTNGTDPCFVGGNLSSFQCYIGGERVTRKIGYHPNSTTFHYVFDGSYMALRPVSRTVKDMTYQMRKNVFTFIAWVRGSNVHLLLFRGECDGKSRRQEFSLSISSGRLTFSLLNSTIANLQPDTLYKLAIVYRVTHFASDVDGYRHSWHMSELLRPRLAGCRVLELLVGMPVTVKATPRLSLFCLQQWNRALTHEEIVAAFRRCDMWRPLPVVTSSTLFDSYEKSLRRRCQQTVVIADMNASTAITAIYGGLVSLCVTIGILLVGLWALVELSVTLGILFEPTERVVTAIAKEGHLSV